MRIILYGAEADHVEAIVRQGQPEAIGRREEALRLRRAFAGDDQVVTARRMARQDAEAYLTWQLSLARLREAVKSSCPWAALCQSRLGGSAGALRAAKIRFAASLPSRETPQSSRSWVKGT